MLAAPPEVLKGSHKVICSLLKMLHKRLEIFQLLKNEKKKLERRMLKSLKVKSHSVYIAPSGQMFVTKEVTMLLPEIHQIAHSHFGDLRLALLRSVATFAAWRFCCALPLVVPSESLENARNPIIHLYPFVRLSVFSGEKKIFL